MGACGPSRSSRGAAPGLPGTTTSEALSPGRRQPHRFHRPHAPPALPCRCRHAGQRVRITTSPPQGGVRWGSRWGQDAHEHGKGGVRWGFWPPCPPHVSHIGSLLTLFFLRLRVRKSPPTPTFAVLVGILTLPASPPIPTFRWGCSFPHRLSGVPRRTQDRPWGGAALSGWHHFY